MQHVPFSKSDVISMISTITSFRMLRNQWCVNLILTLIDKTEKTNLLFHVVSYLGHIYVIDLTNNCFKQKEPFFLSIWKCYHLLNFPWLFFFFLVCKVNIPNSKELKGLKNVWIWTNNCVLCLLNIVDLGKYSGECT